MKKPDTCQISFYHIGRYDMWIPLPSSLSIYISLALPVQLQHLSFCSNFSYSLPKPPEKSVLHPIDGLIVQFCQLALSDIVLGCMCLLARLTLTF